MVRWVAFMLEGCTNQNRTHTLSCNAANRVLNQASMPHLALKLICSSEFASQCNGR